MENPGLIEFDAIVFLSHTSWDQELLNSRYDYIKLFAGRGPVYFVQSPGTNEKVFTVKSHGNIHVVNPIFGYGTKTLLHLFKEFKIKKTSKILIWITNPFYIDTLKQLTFSFPTVFALPDGKFIPIEYLNKPGEYASKVKQTINFCSIVFTTSAEDFKKIQNDDQNLTPVYLQDQLDNTALESHLKDIEQSVQIDRFNTLRKKKVLFLYAMKSCHVSTVREHVDAFGLFSRNLITYYGATENNNIEQAFLESFDVIVLHYSVRISHPSHLSDSIYPKLCAFKGLKILFIQDEYDTLNVTYEYMRAINFDIVYTCVPKNSLEYVYPKKLFPNIHFVHNLTGYVSYSVSGFNLKPISQRDVDVFYRGRELPLFYGSLGIEKQEIGNQFKKNSIEGNFGLNLDIESSESSRIYGNAWYSSILNAKAMLGTESGSNVFDFNGDLKYLIEKEFAAGKTKEEIFSTHLAPLENEVSMNQISPKMFEAISLKTVLILFEGEYSGILIPNRHYIPLKKDFSNLEKVVELLKDDTLLQNIADVAFDEIYTNYKYSYKNFVQNNFDSIIDEHVLALNETNILTDRKFYKYNYKIVKGYKFKYLKSYKGFFGPTSTSTEYEQNFQLRYSSLGLTGLYSNLTVLLLKILGFFPPSFIKVTLNLAHLAAKLTYLLLMPIRFTKRVIKFLIRKVKSI